MVSQATFDAQNKIGKSAETRVLNAFLSHFWWVNIKPQGSRRDITVMSENIPETIEVKNEELYASSGNICVETQQGVPKKFSGIMTSESSFYVHCFGDTSLVLRTLFYRLFIVNKILDGELMLPFAKADNFNCGFIIPRRHFDGKRWAKEVHTRDIPVAVKAMRAIQY